MPETADDVQVDGRSTARIQWERKTAAAPVAAEAAGAAASVWGGRWAGGGAVVDGEGRETGKRRLASSVWMRGGASAGRAGSGGAQAAVAAGQGCRHGKSRGQGRPRANGGRHWQWEVRQTFHRCTETWPQRSPGMRRRRRPGGQGRLQAAAGSIAAAATGGGWQVMVGARSGGGGELVARDCCGSRVDAMQRRCSALDAAASVIAQEQGEAQHRVHGHRARRATQ